MNFHIGSWLKVSLEIGSWAGVLGAVTAILPPIASLLGIIYWGIMVYRLLKKRD